MSGTAPSTLPHVPRETLAGLERYVEELRRWQRIKNLIGPGTLDQIWDRHIADSLQLLDLAPPGAVTWVDLGSGAGLPGLPLAIAGRHRPGFHVHLVESNGRKCAFLRHAARTCEAPVTVHEGRIEAVLPSLVGRVDVVTARALAPLADLLAWTAPVLKSGITGLFPKGREAEAELTEARKSWTFEAELVPSRTDAAARIVRVTAVSPA